MNIPAFEINRNEDGEYELKTKGNIKDIPKELIDKLIQAVEDKRKNIHKERY